MLKLIADRRLLPACKVVPKDLWIGLAGSVVVVTIIHFMMSLVIRHEPAGSYLGGLTCKNLVRKIVCATMTLRCRGSRLPAVRLAGEAGQGRRDGSAFPLHILEGPVPSRLRPHPMPENLS